MQRRTVPLHWLLVALFVVNAAIWIAFGISTMVRMGGQGVVAWVVAGLMFGNAGAMLLSGWGLAKRKRGFFFLAIAVVGVNILLTVTDEFGLFDLIVLVIGFALLALLTATRSQYSSAGHKRVNGLESPKGRR